MGKLRHGQEGDFWKLSLDVSLTLQALVSSDVYLLSTCPGEEGDVRLVEVGSSCCPAQLHLQVRGL